MSAAEPVLAGSIVRFAGVLRRAGLAVGTGQSLDAVRAVAAVGVARRDDVYWALHAVLVRRREDFAVFDQAFRRFWRTPPAGDATHALLTGGLRLPPGGRTAAGRRVLEALSPAAPAPPGSPEGGHETDAVLSWSDREALRVRDFEQMSAAELAEAAAMIQRAALPFAAVPARRTRPQRRGRLPDLGASLRTGARYGFDWFEIRYRQRIEAPPPLVVLCDISGSMDRYARMFLRFLHALMMSRRQLQVFLFGTRLTPVTRELRDRDIDAALAAIGRTVEDWSGGTRIGATLAAFNRDWGRRVLAGNAHVLLMTDGLDRDGGDGIAVEMARLRRSCRRVVWLNPLLRFSGFAPLAAGARAMIDHVDDFLPAYNLATLEDLAAVLSAAPRRPRPGKALRHERRSRNP